MNGRASSRVIVERNVPARMRDGVTLFADVWRPDDSRRHDALLQRTPYDKSDAYVAQFHAALDPLRAVEAGFAVVIQDVRGRHASEGTFAPWVNEAQDGYDTVGWINRRPWASGAVGTYGVSYSGATQLLAATMRPDGLRALAPHETAPDFHAGWLYQGGAFQLGFALMWALALATSDLARRAASGEDVAVLQADVAEIARDRERAFRAWPLSSVEPLIAAFPAYGEWLRIPAEDAHWRAISVRDRLAEAALPALHVGGWHDIFLAGTLETYDCFARHAPRQKLVIGPWAHAVPLDTVGSVDYGADASQAAIGLSDLQIDFFKTTLAGEAHAESEPVQVFTMGANCWRTEARWPPARSGPTRWFLHGGEHGKLSREPPRSGERHTDFLYDPADPVPTVGGATFLPGLFVGWNAGQQDQHAVEARADVLVFTSEPLETSHELTGPVSVALFAASTAPDTDWTAKLTVVEPSGRSLNVVDGIIRARFRDEVEHPEPLLPDRPCRYEIDLGATSIRVLAGSSLRVQISSSNFPRFDRNPNTGDPSGGNAASGFAVARQRIFHDAEHPSAITLPIVG
jgi:putative CocE/NonD family hydrolase